MSIQRKAPFSARISEILICLAVSGIADLVYASTRGPSSLVPGEKCAQGRDLRRTLVIGHSPVGLRRLMAFGPRRWSSPEATL